MDVENLLAKASENLSVRRAFGAAYEKDGAAPMASGGSSLTKSCHALVAMPKPTAE